MSRVKTHRLVISVLDLVLNTVRSLLFSEQKAGNWFLYVSNPTSKCTKCTKYVFWLEVFLLHSTTIALKFGPTITYYISAQHWFVWSTINLFCCLLTPSGTKMTLSRMQHPSNHSLKQQLTCYCSIIAFFFPDTVPLRGITSKEL